MAKGAIEPGEPPPPPEASLPIPTTTILSSKPKPFAKETLKVDFNQSPVQSKPSYLQVAQGCNRPNGIPVLQVSNLLDTSSSPALHSALDVESLPLKPITMYQGIPSVLFPLSEKQVLVDKLKLVLVGKFSHGMPNLNKMRKFFTTMRLQRSCTVSFFDRKHIFIECFCKIDYDFIWLHLAWVIDGFTMRVFKWSYDFNPTKESAIVPVWVRLEGLPLYMFDELPLLAIGNAVGKPIKVDPRNVNRSIVNSARICVELDVSKPLLDSIWVSFEDDATKVVFEGFRVNILYDEVPQYCDFCCHLGHSIGSCKRREEKALHNELSPIDQQPVRPSSGVQEGYVVQEGSRRRRVEQPLILKHPQRVELIPTPTMQNLENSNAIHITGHLSPVQIPCAVQVDQADGNVKGLKQLDGMLVKSLVEATSTLPNMNGPSLTQAPYNSKSTVKTMVVQEFQNQKKIYQAKKKPLLVTTNRFASLEEEPGDLAANAARRRSTAPVTEDTVSKETAAGIALECAGDVSAAPPDSRELCGAVTNSSTGSWGAATEETVSRVVAAVNNKEKTDFSQVHNPENAEQDEREEAECNAKCGLENVADIKPLEVVLFDICESVVESGGNREGEHLDIVSPLTLKNLSWADLVEKEQEQQLPEIAGDVTSREFDVGADGAATNCAAVLVKEETKEHITPRKLSSAAAEFTPKWDVLVEELVQGKAKERAVLVEKQGQEQGAKATARKIVADRVQRVIAKAQAVLVEKQGQEKQNKGQEKQPQPVLVDDMRDIICAFKCKSVPSSPSRSRKQKDYLDSPEFSPATRALRIKYGCDSSSNFDYGWSDSE